MNEADRKRLRRRIRLYGWRHLVIFVPRVWRWGTHIDARLFPPRLSLGLFVWKDVEDGLWMLNVGLGLVEIEFSLVRMFTRRERRARLEAYAAERAPQLVEEIERHLGGRS